MYSRGMLGDSSDYTADAPSSAGTPVVNADVAASGTASLAPFLGGTTVRALAQPQGLTPDGVPNVKGLPLRQAVAILESEGLAVSFSGAGCVSSQQLRPGGKVHLTLSI